MLKDLLKINRIPTLEEFKFLLLDVLHCNTPIHWFETYIICKEKSPNLDLSFTDAIDFLECISFININDQRGITLNCKAYNPNELKNDYFLSLKILEKTIESLETRGLSSKVFNNETVTYDIKNDTFLINFNKFPLDFPMIKLLLVSLGLVELIENIHSKVRVSKIYKNFFRERFLLNSTNSADILELEISSSTFKEQVNNIKIKKGKTIFISYSRNDVEFKNELVKHLTGLRDLGLISDWDDRHILPGEKWDLEIKNKLEAAEIIIFLVSVDFIASGYIKDVEIKNAIKRYNNNEVIIIPILLRSCDLASLSIGEFQALPENAKPIDLWDNRDEAYLNVVNQLKRIIEN